MPTPISKPPVQMASISGSSTRIVRITSRAVGGRPVGVLLGDDLDVRVLGERGVGAELPELGGVHPGDAVDHHDAAGAADLLGDRLRAVVAHAGHVRADLGDELLGLGAGHAQDHRDPCRGGPLDRCREAGTRQRREHDRVDLLGDRVLDALRLVGDVEVPRHVEPVRPCRTRRLSVIAWSIVASKIVPHPLIGPWTMVAMLVRRLGGELRGVDGDLRLAAICWEYVGRRAVSPSRSGGVVVGCCRRRRPAARCRCECRRSRSRGGGVAAESSSSPQVRLRGRS